MMKNCHTFKTVERTHKPSDFSYHITVKSNKDIEISEMERNQSVERRTNTHKSEE